ncbi:MAG: hypothetical protein RL748_4602 [Pseudomonadota bacterium]|jgi:signal transduction histidine kinase
MSKRRALFHKYALIFGSLISGSLLISGLISIHFSYQDHRHALVHLQQEKANTAALWISHYLSDLEQQIGFTMPHKPGLNAMMQRRQEIEILRQTPTINQILLLDQNGIEQFRTSRLGHDIIGSGRDLSHEAFFASVKNGKVYHGPISFKDGNEPTMTIAMAVGPEDAGMTVVQINLDFLLDGISRIKVGQEGYTWAVDNTGLLIAHPNLSMVLRKTNLSHLSQVKQASENIRQGRITQLQGVNTEGVKVFTAYSPIQQLGWTVFVEQPQAEAAAALQTSVLRAALLLLAGLVSSIIVSMMLVRKMVVPIHALKEGATKIGGGALAHRIDVKTGDELEDLADQFNRMAAQLQESYTNLEQKVASRTNEMVQEKEKVELAHRHIALLSEIGRDITGSLNREDIMYSLYKHIHDLMELKSFGIGFYHPEKQIIEFPFALVAGVRIEPYCRDMRKTNQLAVWCVAQRKEIFINQRERDTPNYIPDLDFEYERRFFKIDDDAFSESALYVPMCLKDKVVGVISVHHNQKDIYLRFHLDILRTLASYAAVALDNASAYEQLKGAQAQLVFQEKMVSLGTLTAGVAHEINNPANFAHVGAFNLKTELGQFHQFLLQLAGDDAPPELLASLEQRIGVLNQHLATISEGTIRIRDLVKDLRTFSRLDEAESKEIAIADSLGSTINLVRMQYIESTRIVLDLAANPVLECWPAQLNQVFMNLIVNACQAIEARQLSQPGPGLLRISSRADEHWLTLSFEDNGLGMSESTQAHIFEPFFTTKTVGEGMGMGLSISFGIIEKHRGKMEVQSTEGKGTCFIIKLPLRQNALPVLGVI